MFRNNDMAIDKSPFIMDNEQMDRKNSSNKLVSNMKNGTIQGSPSKYKLFLSVLLLPQLNLGVFEVYIGHSPPPWMKYT